MASTNGISVEQRLTRLEDEVRQIREILDRTLASTKPGWRSIVGSHKNSPEFAEIVRLGRKNRREEITVSFKTRKKSKASASTTR
jgi:hypothetical protein